MSGWHTSSTPLCCYIEIPTFLWNIIVVGNRNTQMTVQQCSLILHFCFLFTGRHSEGQHLVRLTMRNALLSDRQVWASFEVRGWTSVFWHNGMFLMWFVWYSLSIWCQAEWELLLWEHHKHRVKSAKDRACVLSVNMGKCTPAVITLHTSTHTPTHPHTHTHTKEKQKQKNRINSSWNNGLLSAGLENVTRNI